MVKINNKRYFIIGITVYIIATVIYVIIGFQNDMLENTKDIDTKLKYAANAADQIIGQDFHDRVRNKNSITNREYMNIATNLSHYCYNTGVKYIYSMYMTDNKVYITTTSWTQEEIEKGEFGSFFEEYPDATEKLKESFVTGVPFFETASDKWGTFKSYLLPKKTKDGRIYYSWSRYCCRRY